MAYNLQSLAHIIDQILHPHPKLSSVHELEKEKLESLLEKVTTLQQILESLPLPKYNKLERLQRQVIDLSHRAEDTVDSAIVNQVSIQQNVMLIFLLDLQNVIEEFDSLINKDLTIVNSSQHQTVTRKFEDLTIVDSSQQQNVIEEFEDMTVVDPTPESLSSVNESQTCRGLDRDIDKLRGQLTRYGAAHLEVISIVGMGGIGKTFLAQKLYHHPSIVKHYDCRAWVTISQEYDVATIFSDLLCCITNNQYRKKEKYDLSERLHKELYGGRFLIILDDIWDTGIWDKLRPFFPDNGRSSTIILTTRDQEVAAYANPSSLHTMHLLGDDDSWDLFRRKVFGEKEDLDPELERLGRNIVENCKGLPLAISVISGFLLECDSTDFWEDVADDISPTVALDEQFSKILSLSYDHLPHHLRPCLLYLGAFLKGAEIQVSRIKRLWVAESFLKPTEDKTPEEAAEQYLEDLKNRNLLLVRERKPCGKVKIYGMHDLLMDLCVKRDEQEDFVVCSEYGHVMKALDKIKSKEAQSLRRVILNNKSFEKDIYKQFCLDNPTDSPSLIDSATYIYSQEYGMVSELLSTSNLVRVLDASEMYLRGCPGEILQLVNIRYLSLNCNFIPPLLSRLWNLETLIFRCDQSRSIVDIPDKIWELGKLKHFKIVGYRAVGRVELHSALETLQTLSIVKGRTSVENLIQRIPNIKQLGLAFLYITDDIDLSSLHNLENLKIRYFPKSSIGFPSSIAKLTLFEWYNMNGTLMKVLGELPGLKVLKIQDCRWNCHDYVKEWRTNEGGFPSLNFLESGIEDLEQWNIEEETHFPALRHLIIRGCWKLEDIPSCIGDIPMLEIIEADKCCKSVVASTRRIWEEQRDMSNDGLQFRIRHEGVKWEYL